MWITIYDYLYYFNPKNLLLRAMIPIIIPPNKAIAFIPPAPMFILLFKDLIEERGKEKDRRHKIEFTDYRKI